MILLLKCRYLNCTKSVAQRLGVNAPINARGGELWRNDMSIEDIEMMRDGNAIKDRINKRISLYQFNSKWFRRNIARLSHLLSNHFED